MSEGHFCRMKHRGFLALLYHTGVRVSEALRAEKEQFTFQSDIIFFDVLKRLKHGRLTPPLQIPLDKPHARTIQEAVEDTKPKKRVWPYSRTTGYLIVARVFNYPHHLRLSKFTALARFTKDGKRFGLAQLVNWTGLNPVTLGFYIGIVDIEEMGKA